MPIPHAGFQRHSQAWDAPCRILSSSRSETSLDSAIVAREVLITIAGWKEKEPSGFSCGVMDSSAKETAPFTGAAGKEEFLPYIWL